VGVDFPSFEGYDWELLKQETLKIVVIADELQLWIVLGSSHRLSGQNRPHNSVYLVGPKGRIIDRYDKRFCTAKEMEYFTPGNRFVVFTINGVKCSLLICFDLRFPELYRELYKQGVSCVFQSFYNARQKRPSVHTHIMRQTMQCHAATNHFWVSMTNSSGYYSPYPSCFITPDGVIANQLKVNQPGMMVNTVDLHEEFYDPMSPFRDSVVGGALSNGPMKINDTRSRNTKSF
jgi:predicted amidohydrolase